MRVPAGHGQGHLIADTTVSEVVAQASLGSLVRVRTAQAEALRSALAGDGVSVSSSGPGLLEVRGLSSAQVGETAARRQIVLHELFAEQASLSRR